MGRKFAQLITVSVVGSGTGKRWRCPSLRSTLSTDHCRRLVSRPVRPEGQSCHSELEPACWEFRDHLERPIPLGSQEISQSPAPAPEFQADRSSPTKVC